MIQWWSIKCLCIASIVLLQISCGGGGDSEPQSVVKPQPMSLTKEQLGKQLFSDVRLSQNRTQSCATCHNSARAFIDDRSNASGNLAAGSLGDDGVTLGDRNSPTVMYAKFSPSFGRGTKQRFNSRQNDYEGFLGGQFLDGRALDLVHQAKEPPVSAAEMNLPDKATVSARIQERPEYVAAFKNLYGEIIFNDSDAVFDALADSIAAFEKTAVFSPFSSKYDKSLRGEYTYSPLSKATTGKALFFSQQFTNCATCHQLNRNGSRTEIFTSFEYHNIGVPKNKALRALNGKAADFVDEGLFRNPAINDVKEKGKFKVPTLRNASVTAPYMHNGVFKKLRTVILFYDHFQTASTNTINPETGVAWQSPEVNENLALTELRDGRLLTDQDIDALVCFIHTLTDEQYEHLIPDDGLDCGI